MLLSLLIVAPLLLVLILNLLPRGVQRHTGFWCAALFGLTQIVLVLLSVFNPQVTRVNPFGPLFTIKVSVDSLSLLVLLSIGIITFVALLMVRYFILERNSEFNFINLLLLTTAGLNGVTISGDIFTMYVFLEVVSAASFILIVINRKKPALEAAFKYIVLSTLATIMMLSSIALLLLIAGDTHFASIRAAFHYSSHNFLFVCAVGFFICGAFIKGGVVPFHGWLPEAYSEAPAPVSVLLAGIVTKTVGIYALIRIANSVFGAHFAINNLLLFGGSLSIVLGALGALAQNDLKRILAYSSISQVGYIVIGLGSGTALGLAAAMFHLFNHSIFKALLFVNSAAIEAQTKTRNVDAMGGLQAKMPYTAATSVLASLSAAGVPPLAGFWSKLLIIIALVTSGHTVCATVAVVASVLTLAYLLFLQRKVFFGSLNESLAHVKEVNAGLLLPAIVLAIITVGAGIFFPFLLKTFILPIESVFGG
ncbi:MAG: proton-conducting transporter membrane subunit [Candidatus Omnitrophica bacterium]|nr:proton-conducting transporter membrane subunit [Candidatus Omnitrophota bacterium]